MCDKGFPQPLRHPGDARTDVAAMFRIAHIAAQDDNVPLLNHPRARNQRQQARLTHPVRTNQPDHTTGGNVQRDIVQRDRFSVMLAHPSSCATGGTGTSVSDVIATASRLERQARARAHPDEPGHSRQTGFDIFQMLSQQLWRNTRFDAEHQLQPFIVGFHGFGRELRHAGDKLIVAGIRRSGAASSTSRASPPIFNNPACSVGRKNVI